MFNIIGRRNFYIGLSGALIVISLVSSIGFGFKQGIDFAGGTLWQISFQEEVGAARFTEVLKEAGMESVTVTMAGDGSLIARTSVLNEDEHARAVTLLKEQLGSFEEQSFQSIGPSIGRELRTRAILAVVLVLFGISAYVAFAFRKVSEPVASWKYGTVTLLTLFHDVMIPVGLFASLGYFLGVEVDTNFIVALLVIAGFSVHDTIVVFDRTRENLAVERGRVPFDQVVNKSVNQTLARSVNTSLTLIFVLTALYFAGPPALKYFILTILVGTVVGTYSSVFLASPLLVAWHSYDSKRK